jgi:hypothetical protein
VEKIRKKCTKIFRVFWCVLIVLKKLQINFSYFHLVWEFTETANENMEWLTLDLMSSLLLQEPIHSILKPLISTSVGLVLGWV